MLKELGWLSVTDRLKHNKATLIYKALNNKTPDFITNLLKPMSEVHTLNLRSTAYGTYVDHELVIDPSPRGNFVHYDFLKLRYIRSKMTHVGLLAVGALPCNSQVNYVTL